MANDHDIHTCGCSSCEERYKQRYYKAPEATPKKADFHPKEIVTPTIKTKIHTMKTYVIEMNEEEATWLRGIMQNPLYNLSPDQEEDSDSRMRMAFFNAVKSAGRP